MKLILKGGSGSGWYAPPRGTHAGGKRALGGGAVALANEEIRGARASISRLEAKGRLSKSDRNAIDTYRHGIRAWEKRIARYRRVGGQGLSGDDLATDGYIDDYNKSSVSKLLAGLRGDNASVAHLVDRLIDDDYVLAGQKADLTKYLS